MKKTLWIACFLTLMFNALAFAQQPQAVGAGESGFALSAGYNGAWLNYKEIAPNSTTHVLDQDTGWLNGATVEGRYDGRVLQLPFFVRANFDYVGSGNATYKGALQNGTSLTMSTTEDIYKTEFNLGIKVWNPSHFSLAPYLGAGYRDWLRGHDILPDYREKYRWGYGVGGIELKYGVTGSLLIGIDGAVLLPFSPEMTTDIAGIVDSARFHIKSRLGYRVQIPASYDIYTVARNKDELTGREHAGCRIFIFMTPYYERWNVGQSPVITLTWGGIPVATALEPTSHTDLYGVKVGIGVNF